MNRRSPLIMIAPDSMKHLGSWLGPNTIQDGKIILLVLAHIGKCHPSTRLLRGLETRRSRMQINQLFTKMNLDQIIV